jgi:hypothetical protein
MLFIVKWASKEYLGQPSYFTDGETFFENSSKIV